MPPAALWQNWSGDPAILIVLTVVASLYLWGSSIQSHQAKAEPRSSHERTIAFWSALAIVMVILASPLGELANGLFAGHTVQHILLMLIAAPLFVLSAPGRVLSDAVPRPMLDFLLRAARIPLVVGARSVLSQPLFAGLLYALVLWVSSLPALARVVQDHRSLHAGQHVMLFSAALLLWWSILRRSRMDAKHRGLGAGIILAIMTALQSSLLGAVLAFAAQPWYVATVPQWGLAPLVDQQIAGLVIWIPSSAIFTLTAGALFNEWLNVVERDVRERERRARMEYQPPRPPQRSSPGTLTSNLSPGLAEVTNSGD